MKKTINYFIITLVFSIPFACTQKTIPPSTFSPEKKMSTRELAFHVKKIIDSAGVSCFDTWSMKNDYYHTFYRTGDSGLTFSMSMMSRSQINISGNFNSFYKEFGIPQVSGKNDLQLKLHRYANYTLHNLVYSDGTEKTIDSVGKENYKQFYAVEDPFDKAEKLASFIDLLKIPEAFKNTKYGYTFFVLGPSRFLSYLPDNINQNENYRKKEMEYDKKNCEFLSKNWCFMDSLSGK